MTKLTFTDADLLTMQRNGMSQIKIAKQIGVTPNAVAGRLNRAKKRLGIPRGVAFGRVLIVGTKEPKHGCCRHIAADPRDPAWVYCGRPIASVLVSYCPEHVAMCYQPVKPSPIKAPRF